MVVWLCRFIFYEHWMTVHTEIDTIKVVNVISEDMVGIQIKCRCLMSFSGLLPDNTMLLYESLNLKGGLV